MITGRVSKSLIPVITLEIGGIPFDTVVDTGFNGYLELPNILRSTLQPRFAGRIKSLLGGGQRIEEDVYLAGIPFDGELVEASVTFVDGDKVLLGTQMLKNHRVVIDFKALSVVLDRA